MSDPRLKRGLPPVNSLIIGRVTGCQVKDSSDLSAENPFEKDVSLFPLPRPMPGGNLSDGIFNKRSIAACVLLSSSVAKTFFCCCYPVRSNKYFCFAFMVFSTLFVPDNNRLDMLTDQHLTTASFSSSE